MKRGFITQATTNNEITHTHTHTHIPCTHMRLKIIMVMYSITCPYQKQKLVACLKLLGVLLHRFFFVKDSRGQWIRMTTSSWNRFAMRTSWNGTYRYWIKAVQLPERIQRSQASSTDRRQPREKEWVRSSPREKNLRNELCIHTHFIGGDMCV